MSTAQSVRSLLVVAYYMPPWGGGPVFRTLKLVKYLARLSWRCTILTAEPQYYEPVSFDPTLADELPPGTRLVRTASLEPAGSVARGFQAAAVGKGGMPTWAARLLPLARALYGLLVPDGRILWLPHALVAGRRLLREEQPHCILATAPPHSTALIGYLLARLGRCPLVVDFRDDWVGNPLYGRRSAWRGRLEAWLERAVVQEASAVLVPTDASLRRLVRRYPVASARIHVIPNGYDSEDLPQPQPGRPSADQREAPLRCLYAGLVTPRRSLDALLAAVQLTNAEHPNAVHLALAGFTPMMQPQAGANVEVLGYLPHREALQAMANADVGVLISTFEEGAQTAVPSKLYEYVACGTPVLALADAGATSDIVSRNDWGIVCAPRDVEGIARALSELSSRKQRGAGRLNGEAVDRARVFSRETLAARVAAILDTVTGSYRL